MKITQTSLFRRRLIQQWDLLRELVSRDMKLLYKRSFLGIAWTLINPLLQLAVFAFVFQAVIPINIPRYASFVFTGLLSWNWFQTSLYQATGVIIANRPLVRQPGFPMAILPVVITTTGLIHFILALPVLIMFLLWDGVQLTPVAFYLPILQLIQFALTVTLSYLLAALNVTFRDTQHTLGVLLQLLFYLVPIFYDDTSVKNIPLIYYFNPMVQMVKAYRDILMQGTQPDWTALLIMSLVIVVCLPLGLAYFRRQSLSFVEEI
ncbi:ABC transporter permease [Gloeothece verrucosa]|uniref:Transport permease protein n=1 Tax=Gloeothece verrucosa (strain PCC 7822) TaxID=497965 RepID=E0UL17_GLOV7|nr:ABC transporter permease [Gloeothece verrucosa]ADN17647.1 ABC-2 type transporter [Gloeothece verrucosa PCC 7822]